ncbi:MAG TPA: HEAT repeat domain-containing protein [Nostocaceae cyanobacterium]|nr:HEAT repeat domain-containing protein [Nostocaceae cyanobacterium]
MAIDIPQFLQKSPTTYNPADWSALIEYLQNDPDIVKNQPHLLELALSAFYLGDFQQRWEISKILTGWGKIAIPLLIEILEDEEAEEELRWYVVRILGELRSPEVVQPLVNLLNHSENEELQAIAAATLGQMGKIAITALTQLLQQEETKLLAVRSLSQIRHKETITPLLTVVNDANNTIRLLAIEALSSFHDSRIPPVLLQAINDVAATVRKVAIIGLGFRPELREELDLVNQLQPRLFDCNLEVCCAAVTTLSRLGGDAVAENLFPVLISPYTPVILQIEIVRALSWMGTTSGLKYLQTAFSHPLSPTVWQEMVIVLGRVKQSDLTLLATDILLELLEHKHPATAVNSVKSAIALSLGHLHLPKAIPSLTLLLNEPDPQVRLHAMAALKAIRPGEEK